MKWTGAASFAATALQLVRLVVLARLLSPEDFGLMAMITVLMGFAGTFADTGFSNAIIFKQEATKEQISSLYWDDLDYRAAHLYRADRGDPAGGPVLP